MITIDIFLVFAMIAYKTFDDISIIKVHWTVTLKVNNSEGGMYKTNAIP